MVHHWTKLGLALSTGYSGGDFAAVEGVISDLVELLGADHKRLVSARRSLISPADAQSGTWLAISRRRHSLG